MQKNRKNEFACRQSLPHQSNVPEWLPLSIAEVVQLLQPLSCKWILAGGWALDTFLGAQTREHSDIDVLIPRVAQLELQKCLGGWDLQVAEPPGALRPWQRDEFLERGRHDIWCRPDSRSPWKVQFMLFDTENDQWIYRRNDKIRGPLESMSLQATDGFWYLAPEIQLLYKSKGLRNKDQMDFESVLSALTETQRSWLRKALEVSYPEGHEWISRL